MEGRRVIVIAEADQMTIEATNSLLKILEEPPDFTHLVLTTSKPNLLLPTILSRCQEIRFFLLAPLEIEEALLTKNIAPDQARLVSRIAQGSYRRALEWLQEDLNARRNFVVDFLRICLKDQLAQIQFVEETIQSFDKSEIKDILNLVLLWFRDALIMQNLAQHPEKIQENIINIDQLETLTKFVNAFEYIDYDNIIPELEKSIDYINRNLQLNLILLVLLVKFKAYMKLKK